MLGDRRARSWRCAACQSTSARSVRWFQFIYWIWGHHTSCRTAGGRALSAPIRGVPLMGKARRLLARLGLAAMLLVSTGTCGSLASDVVVHLINARTGAPIAK